MLFAAVALLLAPVVAVPQAPAPTDPALRKRLLLMARDDQTEPSPPGAWDRNAATIREIVATYGWPGKTLVGEDGAHAAWLVVQHQDTDVAFQRTCLELMKPAYAKGEVAARDLAFLTDRVFSNEGRPQVYGTQGIGVRSPEDEARIDANRLALGLEPWREFVKWRQEHHGPWLPTVDEP